jgi:hypothetical protein
LVCRAIAGWLTGTTVKQGIDKNREDDDGYGSKRDPKYLHLLALLRTDRTASADARSRGFDLEDR